MSSDLVKAEVQAVRTLRHAVTRYAEQLREASNAARRDVAAAEARAREAVERRRGQLQRAEQELAAAQASPPGCKENSARAGQAVADAQRRVRVARQLLDRARKASQIVSSAQSDLAKSLQALDATVGEHSSVASAALASLDGKLSHLPHFDLGHALQSATVGVAVAIETVTAAPNLANLVGNAGAAFGADLPTHTSSLSEMGKESAASAQEFYASKELDDLKRATSGEGQETIT